MSSRLRAVCVLVLAAALLWGAGATAAGVTGTAVDGPGTFAHTLTSPVSSATPLLSSPASPLRAVRGFDPPPERWLAGHRGIDLAAEAGTTVSAPGPGVVTVARRVVDRGVVTVDHGGGLLSSFEPVEAAAPVGTAVARGDPLGVVAVAGHHCATQPCLHWGVRLRGEYVDPLDLLVDFGPVVLLPVRDGGP